MQVKVSKRGISSLYFSGKRELAMELHRVCEGFLLREVVVRKKVRTNRKAVEEIFPYYVLEIPQESPLISYLKKIEKEEGVVLLPSTVEEDLKNRRKP